MLTTGVVLLFVLLFVPNNTSLCEEGGQFSPVESHGDLVNTSNEVIHGNSHYRILTSFVGKLVE
jgi:hypothetical protein